MKRFLIVACLFASSSVFATTAFWTGNKEKLQSEQGEVKKKQPQPEQVETNKDQPQPEQGETNKELPQPEQGEANKAQPQPEKIETRWKCEYRVAYTTQLILVWRTFPDFCPAEIELESDGDS
jgi:hypothetical protein